MKKINLLTLFFALFAAQVIAQTCTPDPTLPDSVIVSPLPVSPATPDAGIQEEGCVGDYYETYFYFNIPTTIEVGGTMATLTSIEITDVTNIPSGFDYACNPDNCTFLAGEQGCVVLYGTPVAGEEGQYDISVSATAIASGFPITMTLPDPNIAPGNYYLNINAAGDCTTATEVVSADKFAAKVTPNPLMDIATLSFTANQQQTAQLVVTDLTGKKVWEKSFQSITGENTIDIDAATWASGIYLYTVNMDNQQFSGKLVVNK